MNEYQQVSVVTILKQKEKETDKIKRNIGLQPRSFN